MRVRAGFRALEAGAGSAGRMHKIKSAPAESRTREEGKNWSEVVVLLCTFPNAVSTGGVLVALPYIWTEPSRNPVAN